MSDPESISLDANDNSTPAKTVPYERFSSVVAERNRLKELADKYEQLETYRLEQEQLAKGQHEQVIAELKPKAERLLQIEAVVNDMLAMELAALPEYLAAQAESILALIPNAEGKLKAIRNLQQLAPTSKTPPPVVKTDAGKGSNTDYANAPTKQDIEWAAMTGVSIEQYMKHK